MIIFARLYAITAVAVFAGCVVAVVIQFLPQLVTLGVAAVAWLDHTAGQMWAIVAAVVGYAMYRAGRRSAFSELAGPYAKLDDVRYETRFAELNAAEERLWQFAQLMLDKGCEGMATSATPDTSNIWMSRMGGELVRHIEWSRDLRAEVDATWDPVDLDRGGAPSGVQRRTEGDAESRQRQR